MVSVEEQLGQLCRGVVDVHVLDELRDRLASSRRLRVKAGFDPTRPDLHIGHTVLLEKMRQFQQLGHEVVFVVGDFTAMVGDPTGRNEQRPRLSREQVMAAAETYQRQAFKILDQAETVVRYNSDWLGKLSTVELVELGGTDQLFNLLVGRDIMPRYGKRAQIVMTTPLLEGIDARLSNGKVLGVKMSKSADNYVALEEPPFEMLQKLMLIDDQVVWHFMELLSPRSAAELAELRRSVDAGQRGIVDAKEQFAIDIVTRYHGVEAAEAARSRRRSISAGDVPVDAPEIAIEAQGQSVGLAKALQLAGLAPSTSEAMRLCQQGGVQLDQERATDGKFGLRKGARYLVRVGGKRRRFAYLLVR